uniref:Uncharacterized protein n=1 Tax=Cannabis sativa TaxID=3483 RepID=A0A803PS76_CANSA
MPGTQLPGAILPVMPQTSGVQFSATSGYTQNLTIALAQSNFGVPTNNPTSGMTAQLPAQSAPVTRQTEAQVPLGGPTMVPEGQIPPGGIPHQALEHDGEICEVTQLLAQRPRLIDQSITFTEEDPKLVRFPYHDPLVIKTPIANKIVARILVDNESSVNLLFKEAFTTIGLTDRDLSPSSSQLTRFNGTTLIPMGKVRLHITLCLDTPQSTFKYCTLVVVDCPTAYNAILGRPALVGFGAVTSIRHLCCASSFPLRQLGQKRCKAASSSGQAKLDPLIGSESVLEPMEDIEEVGICDQDPTKVIRLGKGLDPEE